MSNKIRVLVVPSDRAGVGYYRSLGPAIKLQQLFPDDFEVVVNYAPFRQQQGSKAILSDGEIDYLKQFDIIHYHRTLGASYDHMDDLLDILDKYNIITIMDLDDHWDLSHHHPLKKMFDSSGQRKKVAHNVRSARNVTTTTKFFREEMRRDRVTIIPNGIDPLGKGYSDISRLGTTDKPCVGWLGGSSHLADLALLAGVAKRLEPFKGEYPLQWVVCGFDLRGYVTYIDKDGSQKKRPIEPLETVWYKYEQIFTNNYSIVSDEYETFLKEFKEEDYPNVDTEPYRRRWTIDIMEYAENYRYFDISLAPLTENRFNYVKSPLKVAEAGFHKKAIIAQDFGPYTEDIIDGVNGFLIPTKKNKKLWYQRIKQLIENQNMREDMSEKLHELVVGKYHIDVITAQRAQYYKDLINERQGKKELKANM